MARFAEVSNIGGSVSCKWKPTNTEEKEESLGSSLSNFWARKANYEHFLQSVWQPCCISLVPSAVTIVFVPELWENNSSVELSKVFKNSVYGTILIHQTISNHDLFPFL